MAQTKRKRRSKHRGTAAGTIETRGRTGRPPTPQERKRQDRVTAREKRLNTPPTWKSSLMRALIAAVLVLFRQSPGAAISLAAFMVLVYLPMGYYTDLFLYRRRQRKKAEEGRRDREKQD